jgi:hypothetical protein
MANSQSLGTFVLDNSGLPGTNTPVSSTLGFYGNLSVTNGAIAEAQSPLPVFSNITLTAGSALTSKVLDSSLFLGVLGNVSVDSSSAITTDAEGYSVTNGPGTGNSLASQGSGGGYGGAGGLSASGALGGVTNGALTQPVSFGSGGGAGSSSSPSGSSQGGGVMRLSVFGTLDLEGSLRANGNPGIQDDSGGGSGGSIWLSANKLTGAGNITADGGDGDLYGGGGGGGGRIAIYSPANSFTGLVSVAGGDGAFIGQTGTIFTSTVFGSFSAISSSPTNTISNTVSFVDINFSDAVNPNSLSASVFNLFTPVGLLAQSNLTVSSPNLATVRFSFPVQNYPGNYRLELGTGISDLFGNPMSQTYTGYFTVTLPLISGLIVDTNSQPVSGGLLQPTGGLQPATTDATGACSLGVPPGWNGSITPILSGSMFIPSSRTYTNVTTDTPAQNYTLVPTIAASIQLNQTGTNLFFNWRGYTGVSYQLHYSTDLVTWFSLAAPVAGTNGPMQFSFPIDGQPQKFFRILSQD